MKPRNYKKDPRTLCKDCHTKVHKIPGCTLVELAKEI